MNRSDEQIELTQPRAQVVGTLLGGLEADVHVIGVRGE
jgi:hypothetical protein